MVGPRNFDKRLTLSAVSTGTAVAGLSRALTK